MNYEAAFYAVGAFAIWMTMNNMDRAHVIKKLRERIEYLEHKGE